MGTAKRGSIPATDDLAGWKAADKRLFDYLAGQLQDQKWAFSRGATARYFDDDDPDYFFDVHEQRSVVPAYVAWAVLDYRRDNKTTLAARLLKKGLPEPRATLLRARMQSHPTLYRVVAHTPIAGTVEFEDVLLGGTVTVHDRLMSENIQDGLFICARAFPAGNFRFLELAGPPLGAGMGTEAVDFLRESGVQFTPDGLRRDAHKFGWLWQWVDDWEANWRMPQLRNTDGDELLWHTASFTVDDEQQARRSLLERPDVEDEGEQGLIWFRGNREVLGENVTLGRIEFIGDELVLSVNSAERFAAARRWLEEIPGVKFSAVQTRRLEDLEDRPPDELISPPEPVEMTPEFTEAANEMIRKHYMAWLDMPLPMLGGQTPRQLCSTAAGRQRVAMLIRTISEPMGPSPVQIPREAMLRELGLEDEPVVAGEEPPDVWARTQEDDLPQRPADVKVGPNTPCTCGSGRKYKKCCGRLRS